MVSFPNSQQVKQATTSLAVDGPSAPGSLRASAWKTQAGRQAPDFTWTLCAGDPARTQPQPIQRAFVKYTAGPNRFGGTMGFVISAGANPSRLVLNAAAPAGAATFVPFVDGRARPTGRGFAVKVTDPAVPGSAWAMTMATSMGRITMGTTYLGPRPLRVSRMVYGFPFTTGQVVVRVTGSTPGPAKSPATVTLSATGGDTVTAMGARNLSLVAGSLAAYASLDEEIGLNQIALPESGRLLQQAAAAVALLAIAASRRRSARARR